MSYHTASMTFGCPETLRSAGVAPKPAPVRLSAWATYEVLGHGRAFVEVTYLGAPQLYSMMRVEVRNPGPDVNGVDHLYEEGYRLASLAARTHGYELDRFSRVPCPGATHA
jgi:hypothetical protein